MAIGFERKNKNKHLTPKSTILFGFVGFGRF